MQPAGLSGARRVQRVPHLFLSMDPQAAAPAPVKQVTAASATGFLVADSVQCASLWVMTLPKDLFLFPAPYTHTRTYTTVNAYVLRVDCGEVASWPV